MTFRKVLNEFDTKKKKSLKSKQNKRRREQKNRGIRKSQKQERRAKLEGVISTRVRRHVEEGEPGVTRRVPRGPN